MATTKLLQCPSCFATVGENQEECTFCGNKLVIESVSDLDTVDAAHLRNYGRSYMQNIQQNVGDPQEMEGALAFVFLKMKLYEKAQDHFSKAIDDFCFNPELYYGWAISILNGKGAYGCYRETVDEANRYLDAAISIEKRGIYYYMKAFIAFDYFYSKGFKFSPTYVDYLKMAVNAGISRKEIGQLYELLNVSCPNELRL